MPDTEKGPVQTIVEFEMLPPTQQRTSRMLFDYADALRTVGRRRDAEKVYNALDLESVPEKKRWLVHLFRGQLCQDAGRYGEAETLFRTAVSLNPLSTVPWIHLAASLAEQEKFEDAVSVLQGAEDLDGDQDELHLIIGYSLRTLGRLPEAQSHLRKALTITPDYPEALETLNDVTAAIAVLNDKPRDPGPAHP